MSRRIAIVEDEPAIRDNLRDALVRQGLEVQGFADRREAQAALASRLPDMAIIDVGLGDEPDGGFELCRWLRERAPVGFELIAVAMAYDDPEQVRKFARSKGLPFRVVLDTSGSLARSFDDTKVVPTTYLIDRKGNLVSRTLGAIDFPKLRQYLDSALGA